MDIIAPVTDYAPASLLTTLGDLYKRGATGVERFPVGAANEVLKMNAAGNDLEYGTPVVNLFTNEYQGHNTGNITILSGSTLLVSLDLGTVSIGDRIMMNATLKATKGVTAGLTNFLILKNTGTAVVQALSTDTKFQSTWWQVASQYSQFHIAGIFRVSTAGTLVMRSMASSPGSNSLCSIGEAALYFNALKQ